MRSVAVDLAVELAKLRLRTALLAVRRAALARFVERLPTELLDDVRLAATDELARRGLHVITHRFRSRNVG